MQKSDDSPVGDEAMRLAAVMRMRKLLVSTTIFDPICRLASDLLRADASLIALLTDTEQVFIGRNNISAETIPRMVPSKALWGAHIDLPDLASLPPTQSNPLVNGKLDRFRSALCAPLRFEGQPVGLLTCCFRKVRECASPAELSRLYDLREIAERTLVQEVALATVARTAVAAIDKPLLN